MVSKTERLNISNFKKKSLRQRKVVLITGASIGIGLALAKLLIENDNYFLVLTARETSQFRFKNEFIYESEYVWL
ncbi:MAG: hypothetical protein KDD61_09560, partial [Bdellovibrionales bacterium]|nr:hypothetical protein [Bdellovibrionales bacterium]